MYWRRARIELCALATVLTTLLIAAPLPAQASTTFPPPGNQTNTTYVALGDSYSSGEGVGPFYFGTEYEAGDHQGCHRSTAAYGPRIARTLFGKNFGRGFEGTGGSTDLAFVACSGAVIDNLANAGVGNQQWDSPVDRAQLDYLGARTKYATLTVGGNDAGFGDLLAACLVVAQGVKGSKPSQAQVFNAESVIAELKGTGTRRLHAESECSDEISEFTATRISGLRDRLAALYREILRRAPNARVVVATYPHVLPDSYQGKYVADVHLCTVSGINIDRARAGFLAPDVTALQGFQQSLADEIRAATSAVGQESGGRLQLVDVYSSTASNGINCGDTGVTSYISAARMQFIAGKPFVGTSTASFHPTSAGQKYIAGQITPALTQKLAYAGGTWAASATVGEPFSSSRFLTGGMYPLQTTTGIDGNPPPWLALGTAGQRVDLSGTPDTPGSHTFVIYVTDAQGNTASIPVTLTVTMPGADIITTVAGNGTFGDSGDGGPATAAEISNPWGIATSPTGDVYFVDHANARIRRVSSSGIISTAAGTGVQGFSGDGGPATAAQLDQPEQLAIDTAGNLYIADTLNRRVRKVSTSGIITTVAGGGSYVGSGDDIGDGRPATSVALTAYGVTTDRNGNLFISDNARIRQVTPDGIIHTYAGTGVFDSSGDGGPAVAATLYSPEGLATDGVGNLYIAETGRSHIRMVGLDGVISTVAGNGTFGYSGDGGPATAAALNFPHAVSVDAAGNLYIADTENNVIRRVDTAGFITTVAGCACGGALGDGGPATAANLAAPFGVAVAANGDLYITDTHHSRVRRVGEAPSPPDGPVQLASIQTSAANRVVTIDTHVIGGGGLALRSDQIVTDSTLAWTCVDPTTLAPSGAFSFYIPDQIVSGSPGDAVYRMVFDLSATGVSGHCTIDNAFLRGNNGSDATYSRAELAGIAQDVDL